MWPNRWLFSCQVCLFVATRKCFLVATSGFGKHATGFWTLSEWFCGVIRKCRYTSSSSSSVSSCSNLEGHRFNPANCTLIVLHACHYLLKHSTTSIYIHILKRFHLQLSLHVACCMLRRKLLFMIIFRHHASILSFFAFVICMLVYCCCCFVHFCPNSCMTLLLLAFCFS